LEPPPFNEPAFGSAIVYNYDNNYTVENTAVLFASRGYSSISRRRWRKKAIGAVASSILTH